jgi:hypothetical protein
MRLGMHLAREDTGKGKALVSISVINAIKKINGQKA